ncbi:MAG: OmpA family protein [Myxococcales bacterium]|nr:OmpA family protein [Myxococcales bacterium]
MAWVVVIALGGMGCGSSGESAAPTPPPATEPTPTPAATAPGEAPPPVEPSTPPVGAEVLGLPNLTSRAAGARVVRSTLPGAYALLDEAPETGWSDSERTEGGMEAILELAAVADVERVEVTFDDYWVVRRPEVVTLEVGDGAAGPWRPLARFEGPREDERHRVGAMVNASGRFVRVHLLGRLGGPDEALGPGLQDVAVRGRFRTSPPAETELVGNWHGGWLLGGMEVREVGGRLQGCLDRDADADVEITVDGRAVQLRWTHEGGRTVAIVVRGVGGELEGTMQTWDPNGEAGGVAALQIDRMADRDPICERRAPPPPASALERELESGRARLYGVLFDFAQATPRPESSATLDDVAAILSRHPDWNVRLEGHTDAIGDPATNQRLSAQRVSSVLDALVSRGVARERLASEGFGQTRPVATNETPTGRAQNRRVEIVRGD